MGCYTSAMRIHGSNHLCPRLRVSECSPYIWMGVLFIAMGVSLFGERQWSVGEGGMALTSDPVSTRKCVRVLQSVTATVRRAGNSHCC